MEIRTKGHAYIHAVHDVHDVVLVDGRFRVAWALAAFRHLAPGGKLLVHDFERPEYHVLLRFYDMVQKVDTLALLTPKPTVDHDALRRALSDHKHDPS